MKDRTLRRLHAIITRCIVYPQISNPIYLKYNKLIGKSQVLKFPRIYFLFYKILIATLTKPTISNLSSLIATSKVS